MAQTGRRSWRPMLVGLAMGLSTLVLAVTGGSTAQAGGAPGSSASAATTYPYQLHMTFFSRETHQQRVIDPQMFVAAAGRPAGVGPQMIRHGAGVAPVEATSLTGAPLLDALGRPLHLTLGQWGAARRDATVSCHAGMATVVSRFAHLLPRSTYSLFVVHLHVQGPRRFTPLGPPDGRASTFVTDALGAWTQWSRVAGCLGRGEAVVLVWHSDGRGHGPSLGQPGITAHNHLIFSLR